MIFKRSFVSELSNAVGGAFTVLFTIVLAVGMVRILALAAGGSIDNTTIAQLTLYNALQYLGPLLTVSTFVAVVMTLLRAWNDNEMAVWFSSGARSLLAWISPVMRFAIPMTLLVAILSMAVTPWATSQTEEVRQQFRQRDDVSLLTPGRFIETNHGKRVFFIDSLDKDLNVKGVFVAETRGDKTAVVTAKTANLEINEDGDRYVVLNDGRRYESANLTAAGRVVEFGQYGVRLDLRVDSHFASSKISAQPTQVLMALNTPAHQAELFWRLSWPIATILLALMAIPLSCSRPRAGRSLGLITAGLVFILYLNGISIVQSWVEKGAMSYLLGLLSLHGVVALVVSLLFIRWVFFMRWIPLWATSWFWRLRSELKGSEA